MPFTTWMPPLKVRAVNQAKAKLIEPRVKGNQRHPKCLCNATSAIILVLRFGRIVF